MESGQAKLMNLNPQFNLGLSVLQLSVLLPICSLELTKRGCTYNLLFVLPVTAITNALIARETELKSAVRAETFIAHNAQVQTKCLRFFLF